MMSAAGKVFSNLLSEFFEGAHKRERSYLLLAGQLTGYKQPQLVVRAFARLNERPWQARARSCRSCG